MKIHSFIYTYYIQLENLFNIIILKNAQTHQSNIYINYLYTIYIMYISYI